MKLHGREIKVGDRVWSIRWGWKEVNKLYDDDRTYPILVGQQSYNPVGFYDETDRFPTLFWNELTFNPADIEPPKPMEIWVNVYPRSNYDTYTAFTNEGHADHECTEPTVTKKFIEVME